MGQIISVNVSTTTGTTKQQVDTIEVRPDHGIEGDAHARNWHRQISLLAQESVDKMIAAGNPDLVPGSFAENITTKGIALAELPIGTRLISGKVELEITQIGKKCHAKCAIHQQSGDCIMPKEGVFAKVLTPGELHPGDLIEVVRPT
ncbi:MAG: MOSC domain-containing protein [Proteobacteria bacterium]|nr:MOSC domain-containing protein [Pseudomonadota bacterium]MBU1687264.1 MOSC domain-containing protein [Pseudomonadota bacterium]